MLGAKETVLGVPPKGVGRWFGIGVMLRHVSEQSSGQAESGGVEHFRERSLQRSIHPCRCSTSATTRSIKNCYTDTSLINRSRK